ncbi:hypothetical protein MACJ_004075 [Theileria orientalis]|uniref:Uncharacterized protein n=1 Tax=Theileria orientalis TaxID=68886 RepID=A0A976SKZ3_THEOR|nr:hypothetical protein MACJ_004075 [Theileria orientalis]
MTLIWNLCSLASYILGLLVAVPLLLFEPGFSDPGRVINLNLDKDGDHSRFIVEKHVIDDIDFYVYYPKSGYQVNSVYSGSYDGWIKNFDLKSDFCYALVNYGYVHDNGLFHEVKAAQPFYSITRRKVVFKCPSLKNHLLRASIALKYIKETHYFSNEEQSPLVTKANEPGYVEPRGFVKDANSLNISDSELTGLHFMAVREFMDVIYEEAPSASQSQPESGADGFGARPSVPRESSTSAGGDNNNGEDELIVLSTPSHTISIQQETSRPRGSVPANESEVSTQIPSSSPTFPSVPEDSTSSLPSDSSGSLAQQQTPTTGVTNGETGSGEVQSETEVLEGPEDSTHSAQPPAESTGSEDPASTVHLDSEQLSEETGSQATSLIAEAESSTVGAESESNESTETTSSAQDEPTTLNVEAEQTSFEDSSEPTLTQDTSIVHPDAPAPEVAPEGIENQASNEPTESEDSTPSIPGPPTVEAGGAQDSSEGATSQTPADSTASVAPELSTSEQPTSNQQDQPPSGNEQGEQNEDDQSSIFNRYITDVRRIHDLYNQVEQHITFSDGVTVTYGFFIIHNTPMRTPRETSSQPSQHSEPHEVSTTQADVEVDVENEFSEYSTEDIPLLSDEESDGENDYDQYLTEDPSTLTGSASSTQNQPSTAAADTVEHTTSTETSSLAQEVASTVQPESSSVDVNLEHTSSEDSTEHTHHTKEESNEIHSENIEDESEFPSSSSDQHFCPVCDCNVWF